MAKIFDNGIYRDAAAEEIEEMRKSQERWEQEQAQNPPQKTPEERIAELEEELQATKILLGVE